jgi:hypothetical protein
VIPITADSTLLSAPRSTAAQAEAYIIALGSIYSDSDIRKIVGYYWRYAPFVGLDPLLAIAQCIHETSEHDPATGRWRPLSSWWAQRPRRNPAGIGVTSEERESRPGDTKNWAEDKRFNPPTWKAGLSFESWDVASRAHIGRLLAFAIQNGEATDQQREMVDFALSFRPLGRLLRGSAHTLQLLGARHNPTGQGWATPGDHYGARIASIASAIEALRDRD